MNATAPIQVICMQIGRVEGRSFDTPMDAAKFLLGQCSLNELRRLVLYDMRAIQRDAAERGILDEETRGAAAITSPLPCATGF